MVTIDGPPPADAQRTLSAARGPWLVFAGLAILLLIGGGILLLQGVDVDSVDSAATLPLVDTTLPGTLPPTTATTVPGEAPPNTTPPTTPGDTTPSPTAPPTAPTTTPTTTAPTTTTTPVPPPTIDRFYADLNGKPCGDGVYWDLGWAITGADSAVVGPTGQPGQAATVPEGNATLCAPSGTTFTLVATNAGGDATATDGGDVVVPPTIVG